MHVKLPNGRGSMDVDDARRALLDASCWEDPRSDMYLSVRTERGHSMLHLIRRLDVGVCLICMEAGEPPLGSVSIGERRGDRKLVVELSDQAVSYPEEFFIPVELACAALDEFVRSLRRHSAVNWRPLRPDELSIEEF